MLRFMGGACHERIWQVVVAMAATHVRGASVSSTYSEATDPAACAQVDLSQSSTLDVPRNKTISWFGFSAARVLAARCSGIP